MCLRDNDSDSEGEDETNDWMDLVERGGFIYISNLMYMVLLHIAVGIRKHLALHNRDNDINIDSHFTAKLLANNDVRECFPEIGVKIRAAHYSQ